MKFTVRGSLRGIQGVEKDCVEVETYLKWINVQVEKYLYIFYQADY